MENTTMPNVEMLRRIFEMNNRFDSSKYTDNGMIDLYKKWLSVTKGLCERESTLIAFRKVTNGELRIANATTNMACIPSEMRPKNGREGQQWNFPYVNFFDLENKGWRCLRIETLA